MKKMTKPEIELIRFNNSDIITTSDEGGSDNPPVQTSIKNGGGNTVKGYTTSINNFNVDPFK